MTTLYWLIIFLCLMISLAYGFWFVAALVAIFRARGVPFVPLKPEQLACVGRHVKVAPTDRVVDLGCGDGQVMRLFESMGATDVSGYEVNYWAYLKARILNRLAGSKSKLYYKNFKKADLGQYTVLFCYLLPEYMTAMRDQFVRQLKPGATIYSYSFRISNWREPDEIIYDEVWPEHQERIFVYRIM